MGTGDCVRNRPSSGYIHPCCLGIYISPPSPTRGLLLGSSAEAYVTYCYPRSFHYSKWSQVSKLKFGAQCALFFTKNHSIQRKEKGTHGLVRAVCRPKASPTQRQVKCWLCGKVYKVFTFLGYSFKLK